MDSMKRDCRLTCGFCQDPNAIQSQSNTNTGITGHHISKRDVIDNVMNGDISAARTLSPSFYVFTVLTLVYYMI